MSTASGYRRSNWSCASWHLSAPTRAPTDSLHGAGYSRPVAAAVAAVRRTLERLYGDER